jgi:hypothetical protein
VSVVTVVTSRCREKALAFQLLLSLILQLDVPGGDFPLNAVSCRLQVLQIFLSGCASGHGSAFFHPGDFLVEPGGVVADFLR